MAKKIIFLLVLFGLAESHALLCRDVWSPYGEILTGHEVTTRLLEVDQSIPMSPLTKENLLYLELNAKEVAAAIAARADQKQIHTVVYPAAGFDGTSALLAFSDAELVIGIDNHPFVLEGTSIVHAQVPTIYKRETRVGWLLFNEVDEQMYTADMLLGRLSHAYRNFRVLRVLDLRDSGGLSHGLIEFDTGEGTQVRQYLHIQTENQSSVWDEKMPWWLRNLHVRGLQGLISKAAMSFFEDTGEYHSLPYALMRILKREHGVFVDGDSHVSPSDLRVTRERTFLKYFGYSNNVRVFVY